MENGQVQRILDSFHVGKVVDFVELKDNRVLVETTRGIFGIVGIQPEEGYGYEDPNLQKKVNKLFGSQHGRLIRTSEQMPFEPKSIIPITHRQDKYWYCLEF